MSTLVDDARIQRVTKIAAEYAAEVDAAARPPHEAVAALKEERLLSCCLPAELGGEGIGVTELARIARLLGASCSATGMIFAMHHSQALGLVRYAELDAVAEIGRRAADTEALIASATTEIGTGGDVSSSVCAVEADGDRVQVTKNAPVVSYAEIADYIFTTTRRGPQSPAGDQVLVAAPVSDIEMTRTSTWDTIGLRGTASPGYLLAIDTAAGNVFPVDYATISASTMLPGSHTLWSAVWLGIADAAVGKARAKARSAYDPDKPSPAALRFADLLQRQQRFEAILEQGLGQFEQLLRTRSEPTASFSLAMNNIKMEAAVHVADIVMAALAIVGINGYRRNHAASMDRLLRDSFGPQLMISNERIRQNNADLALMTRGTR